MSKKNIDLWLRGMFAAIVSGAAGGILTGFGALGIDYQHYSLTNGKGHIWRIIGVAALINAGIGLFGYLKQSPLPPTDPTTLPPTDPTTTT